MSKNIISALSWANDNIGYNKNQKPLHDHSHFGPLMSKQHNFI